VAPDLQERLEEVSMATIAIVEDHEDIAELLKILLDGAHNVKTFHTGASFLQSLRTNTFELILLDMTLTDMEGEEVFLAIRAHDRHVPVVAVTARAHPGQRQKALDMGFCDYLIKPFSDLPELRESILRHLGRCDSNEAA
jgi:two-component system, OmpR family, response regulator